MTWNAVGCATVVRQVVCRDTEGGLRDVALLNVLKVMFGREVGGNKCGKCDARESYKINIGSDFISDGEDSERFCSAGVMYCHLTANVC